MNIDPIIPSTLDVISKTDLDISSDLQSEQIKTIAQLLEENDEKESD
jgi:hypothetical protein